jgi:hypothetical protein
MRQIPGKEILTNGAVLSDASLLRPRGVGFPLLVLTSLPQKNYPEFGDCSQRFVWCL